MNYSSVELHHVSKTFKGTKGSGDVAAVHCLNLQIERGEFFTFLGPSGCGKTTTLRMVAGFEQPDGGDILIEGKSMTFMPPNLRPVNTVFQNYALFPHLNVADNIAFGLKTRRVRPFLRQQKVDEALALVQLPGMQKRKPSQLSGGQQQRVALARALVNEPSVLLLDEPLGALDLKLRKAVQLELKHIQRQLGMTFIYVTHDQEEAMVLSDRIAVMNQGMVVQVGSPRQIYDAPDSRFVADFIGETNFLPGSVQTLEDNVVIECGGISVVGLGNGRSYSIGQSVMLTIRPEKINLYPRGTSNILVSEMGLKLDELKKLFGGDVPSGEVDVYQYLMAERNSNVLEARVLEALYIGTDIRYLVLLPNQRQISVRMQNFGSRYDTAFAPGEEVYVHWPVENGKILVE